MADRQRVMAWEFGGKESSLADGGNLLAHLLRFCRLLRLMGVGVSLSQVLELVEALRYISLRQKVDFYYTARALLINRHEDFALFDQAFQLYWRVPTPVGEEQDAARAKPPPRRARLPGLPEGTAQRADEDEVQGKPSYSMIEILRHKDFDEMTWEEVEAAKTAMAAMQWRISDRPTRRMRRSPHGKHLDLRRVVRDNLRYGGEPFTLRYRERRRRRRPVVVLCDISGSMQRYSRMLLHFLYAFSHRMDRVESFVFGTRLTRITHYLRHRDVDESLDEVGAIVEDWSGGTRIGEAVKEFNFRWARKVLGQGAVGLIISDGWDRGDTGLLSREMSRLQRSVHRLIWLNPLLGHDEYEPVQRGMAAALPFVDDFLSVHNLSSLEQLAKVLSTLGNRRPERKQHVRGKRAG